MIRSAVTLVGGAILATIAAAGAGEPTYELLARGERLNLPSQAAAVVSDRWAPVRFLLGSWEGTSSGQPGNASVRREYRFVLRDQFIEERHTSTYPPQERNPKGEVHEHVSYISYDRARKLLVLRQFHVETFVAQYAQANESPAGRLVFVSEAMENTPPGWRARETYIVHGPDEFEEIFELADTGKPFAVYSRTRLKRVRLQ